MLVSRGKGVLGFKAWPSVTQLKINSLLEIKERKMYFCYDQIKMSLCEAFLEKPRTDTIEDFRCSLLSGAGPRGNLLSGVSMAECGRDILLQTVCRSTVARETWVSIAGEGSDVCLLGCRLMLSLQLSTNTTLTLGVCRILYQHS